MKRLLYLIPLLLALPANGQSLWRNFFTTNRNPIVEVVAGSNATVQASTVGVNLRRFTVNAVPGSSGFASNVFGTNVIGAVPEATHATNADYASYATNAGAGWPTNWPLASITNANHLTNWALLNTNVLSTLGQTNISYTAVTNAPWQYGDSDLTNWATLNTNVLSTLGQTNISYTAVTNAPWQYGSAELTNLATFNAANQTNLNATELRSGTVDPARMATNAAMANQILTATSASTSAWKDLGSDITVDTLNVGTLVVSNPPYLNLANSTNGTPRSVGITIDGGGSAITSGTKGYLEVPYTATIAAATLMADQVGSLAIAVWRTNSTGFPPTAAGSLFTNVLTATNWSRNTSFTGAVSTNISANDFLAFQVITNASAATRVTLQIKLQP